VQCKHAHLYRSASAAGWLTTPTSTTPTVTWSASQQQTLSGTGARVYTAHRGWLGVVTDISAASTLGFLVYLKFTKAVR